jgi:hypothetical protein
MLLTKEHKHLTAFYYIMGGVVPQKNTMFVTAFRDIGRGSWKHYQRPNSEYINYFLLMAENIKHPLIVYLEKPLLEDLEVRLVHKKNIIFKPIDSVKTFYDTHIEKERTIMNSGTYTSLVPERRRINPEHCVPEYTLMMHSKVNFLAAARAQYFCDYGYFAWIDFGHVRELGTIPGVINKNLLGDKIIYRISNLPPALRPTAKMMLASDKIYLSGSSFVVPSELVLRFEELWSKKLDEFQTTGVCDDDQNLALQLYYDDPSMFQLCHVDVSFGLYSKYLNSDIGVAH